MLHVYNSFPVAIFNTLQVILWPTDMMSPTNCPGTSLDSEGNSFPPMDSHYSNKIGSQNLKQRIILISGLWPSRLSNGALQPNEHKAARIKHPYSMYKN